MHRQAYKPLFVNTASGDEEEDEGETHALVHFSLCDCDELKTRSKGEHEGATARQVDDILLEMKDVTGEVLHVRELIGVLVRKERCAETRAEIAASRLDRLEREQDEQDDKESETNLQEALSDKTKAVKLVIDKWFVDKGFRCGKVPTGETVFIHASVVHGGEVLMVGTDAWVQVVYDEARAEGGYNAWKEEKDREKANRVAQQVRRAAALTAELAAQSEKKVAVVCDHPRGLRDEPAEHITAPNKGAGGSHPQAEMIQHSLFASPLLPTGKGFFNLAGGFRGGRPRSTTRAQEAASLTDETLNFFVKATGKDEASMRQQLTSQKREEVRRSRDHWKARAEEEAWRLFERQPGREEFEEELTREVRNTLGNNRGEREKMMQKWSSEMQRVVQPEERRHEARERTTMEQEDSNSQRQRTWEKYGDRGSPSQCRPSHQRNGLDIELAALVSSVEPGLCPNSLRPVPRVARAS